MATGDRGKRTSYEPKRCNAYPADLRWRMVYQREALNLPYEVIGHNLGVDQSTVYRTVKLFMDTGSVDKKQYRSDNLPRKLTDQVQFFIMHLVLDKPGIMLKEIQNEVLQIMNVELALSTICKFLHNQNFSRQKMQIRATQRDEVLRASFVNELSVYSSDMFIFLDETGTDRRDAIRKYGYSWRGRPAVSHKLMVRGEHLSSIAIMSNAGLLDCLTVAGGVDGDEFYQFVHCQLLPHLNPFDGTNKHSIVVMDNASIHHVDGIVDMIEQVGAMVIFLPPYSPDFNPIELLFSKLKKTIKWFEKELDAADMDLETIVYTSFCLITPQNCHHWIEDVAIYPN